MAKRSNNTVKAKKPFYQKWWFYVIIAAIIIGVISGGGNNTSSDNPESGSKVSSETRETLNDATKALQDELNAKYGVRKPSKFVKGDATGNWRVTTIATGTPTSDFVVDYANAYMASGDVHYIVNFTLKTTTMLRLYSNVLDVKTTEYVDKEEHDASLIGQGYVLFEGSYDTTTGEQFSANVDANAGTVDAESLVEIVKEVIVGQVGSDEKIVDVQFDGSNLTVVVDLSGADTSIISARDIAISRISSITDKILGLDDSFTNTWETITIDFGEIGKAVLDKSMIKNQGYGKFFDYDDSILQ